MMNTWATQLEQHAGMLQLSSSSLSLEVKMDKYWWDISAPWMTHKKSRLKLSFLEVSLLFAIPKIDQQSMLQEVMALSLLSL